MSSFTAVIPSNSKGTDAFKNTASHYNTVLQDSLHLEASSNWHVALKELNFVDSILTIVKGDELLVDPGPNTLSRILSLDETKKSTETTDNELHFIRVSAYPDEIDVEKGVQEKDIAFEQKIFIQTDNHLRYQALIESKLLLYFGPYKKDAPAIDKTLSEDDFPPYTRIVTTLLDKTLTLNIPTIAAIMHGFIKSPLDLTKITTKIGAINTEYLYKWTTIVIPADSFVRDDEISKDFACPCYVYTAPYKRMSLQKILKQDLVKETYAPYISISKQLKKYGIIQSKVKTPVFWFFVKVNFQSQLLRIPLQVGYYRDGKHILEAFDNQLLKDLNISIGFNEVKNRLYITSKETYKISFTSDLAEVLGFIKNVAMMTRMDIELIASHSINFMRGINSIYVYCDLCEESIVGNTRAPLLRVIHFQRNKYNDCVNILYNTPYFIPIAKSFINSIEMKLTDDMGVCIPFAEGKVIAVLQFKSL